MEEEDDNTTTTETPFLAVDNAMESFRRMEAESESFGGGLEKKTPSVTDLGRPADDVDCEYAQNHNDTSTEL